MESGRLARFVRAGRNRIRVELADSLLSKIDAVLASIAMRFLALAVFLIFLQQLPNASSILDLEIRAMKQLRTLQYKNAMALEIESPDTSLKTTTTISVYRANPGKMRTESESSLLYPGMTIVSDGTTMWTYNPATKQYTKTPTALGMAAVASNLGLSNMAGISGMLTNLPPAILRKARITGEETIELDGKPRPCWVVEFRFDDLVGEVVAQKLALVGGVVKSWVDKDLGLSLMSTLSAHSQEPGTNKSLQAELTERMMALKTDEPLADSLFTFVPPPDAKEAASPSTPVAPTQSPRPPIQLAPVPPDVVHVFGAGVSPPTVLSRIEPQYTEAARQARLQGTVVLEAFITEDGTAKVVRVVRSLGMGLDENAISAIEQWRFRPAMKDGAPVKAALNIEVNFNLRKDN